MANIIQQFKNANGDNIYPIAYAQGGMKMDLLWTNPSPTSTFAAQTISLDLSKYTIFIIITKPYAAANYTDNYQYGASASSVIIKNIKASITTPAPVNRFREVVINDSSVQFSAAYSFSTYTGTAAADGNDTVIPLYIYGIKMSYVVPTNVQGLQYAEVEE